MYLVAVSLLEKFYFVLNLKNISEGIHRWYKYVGMSAMKYLSKYYSSCMNKHCMKLNS